MKIMIVSKPVKSVFKKSLELAKKLKDVKVFFDSTNGKKYNLPWQKIENFKGDMIITVGGDGTFLWTSHKTNLPILPLRAEGIGFLTRGDIKDVLKNPKIILEKKYKIKKYPKINIFGNNATNEVVISRPKPSKIIKLQLTIDGESFSFMGDGLIISTPLGSTGYNLSAGGPIIYPKLKAFSITPIAPFNSKIKPILIPIDKKIKIDIEKNDCFVILDGNVEKSLSKGESFVVKKGNDLKFVEIKEENFFNKLKKFFTDKHF